MGENINKSSTIDSYKSYTFNILSHVTPFNYLEKSQLEELYSQCEIKTFPVGDFIFKQGERSHQSLYIILEGRARILMEDEKESIKTAGERAVADFFGETVLLTGENYPASVTVLEKMVCLVIPRTVFEKMLSFNQQASESFTRLLLVRLKEMYYQIGEQKKRDILYEEPLHKKVEQVMISPVITCLPGQTIKRTAQQMSRNGITSVVVVAPNGKPVGIVTDKDLVAKVLAEEADAPRYVFQIMSRNLKTVKSSDFAYQAFLVMVKHHINHVIIEEKGQLQGIVTMKDLIKSRDWGTLSAVNSIENHRDIESLADTMEEIDQVQHALLLERAYAREISELVTEFYDRVTRKILSLTEEQMQEEGWGKPPAGYCWISMGSSGRREQYSRTDQDNGIIFEASDTKEKDEAARSYFLKLGEKTVKGLETCGFRRCLGGVMAENSAWCKTLPEWKDTVHDWINRLDPDHIRNMTIFLDFRCVYGREDLGQLLRDEVSRAFKNSPDTLYFLAKDDLQHRVPLNFFRQIITEKDGKINLKSTATVHLIDCVRIFCLREGIKETSTFQRINQLQKKNVFNQDLADTIKEAFETLLMLRIKNYLACLKQGREPDNYIYPARLSKKERTRLKKAMQATNWLQTLVSQNIVMGL